MRKLINENKKTLLLFFVFSFLFYGNSLKNKYALDDDYVTVTNFPIKGQNYIPNHPLVSKGIKAIPKIWKSRYASAEESSFDYRPLVIASFAIEYSVFGQNPFMSHLINILIYFFLVCIIFFTLLKLFENNEFKFTLAFLTSFIFLIHPAHTEVVNNLKSRDELLATLFCFTALWGSLSFFEKPKLKSLLFVLISILLGLYCKKTAILSFAIIPLALFFFRKLDLKKAIYLCVSLVVSLSIFAILKNLANLERPIRNVYHFENPLYTTHFNLLDLVAISFQTLGFYIKFLIFPYPFRAYYGSNTINIYNPYDFSLAIAILFIVFILWYYFKYKNKYFLFASLLFLGAIFPFINLVTPVPGIVGERLCFLSSIGFCLLIAIIFSKYLNRIDLHNLKNIFSKPLIYLIPIIVISFIVTVTRNSNWASGLILFENDIPLLKESAKANSLLANLYFEMINSPNKKYSNQQLVQKSLKHYNLSVTADSSIHTAYNNAGVVFFSYLKDYETAKHFFKLAIRHKPIYPQAYENLGNCFRELKEIGKATDYYIKAIKQNNKQYTAYTSLIKMLFDAKEYKKAYECSKIANTQFQDDSKLLTLEANCLLMMGEVKSSLSKFEEAFFVSQNIELAKFISKKYLEIGDTLNYNIYKKY